MPIRWYLFAVANYIFLITYIFFFLGALRFTAEVLPADVSLGFFGLFIISLAITVFNSAFNLYVFHGYMPARILSRKMKTSYIVSTILFTASLIIVTISLLQAMSEAEAEFKDFLNWVIVLNTAIGTFILLHQFMVRKFLEKNYRH